MLTTAQQFQTLKAAILAETDPTFVALRNSGATGAMAEWYNTPSTATVWKTALTEHEITSLTSSAGTTWDWSIFIAQTVQEQNAWARMFNGTYTINPSLSQVRTGIGKIFSGPAAAAQITHLLAMAKRLAKKGEALFATGTKTDAVPGTLVIEGNLSNDDIVMALAQA